MFTYKLLLPDVCHAMIYADVLSADDAQLVSATCSVVAEPGEEVIALPALLPADNGAAPTVVSHDQEPIAASDTAPAPETGTAARGAVSAPVSKAEDEGSEDEDDDDEDDDEDDADDDDEEVDAGATGRVLAAAPQPPATASGQRSEETGAGQTANGRRAAASKPPPAAATAESSTADEEEDENEEDDEEDEEEDEAGGSQAAAEGQHAAAAADRPRKGAETAGRAVLVPAPAQSSDGDVSSDDDEDDDTSGSDDDGGPHGAANGLQRMSAKAPQRGGDAAHVPASAVSSSPAGRASSAKRRTSAAGLQAPAEPIKVRQVGFLSLDPGLASMSAGDARECPEESAVYTCKHPGQSTSALSDILALMMTDQPAAAGLQLQATVRSTSAYHARAHGSPRGVQCWGGDRGRQRLGL